MNMNTITTWLLDRVIGHTNGNPVAMKLLEHLSDGIKVADINMFVLFNQLDKVKEQKDAKHISFSTDTNPSDCRFKDVKLRGFRKFPYKEPYYYTLDFTKQGSSGASVPASCFIIGSNGSGKTSLFSALQFTCTDKISAAKGRDIQAENYIPYAGIPKEQVDVKVHLADGSEVDVHHPEHSSIAPYRAFLSPFFCSEFDVRQLSASVDISDYILEQTGYQQTKELIERLAQIEEEARAFVKQHTQTAEASDDQNVFQRERRTILETMFDLLVKYRYAHTPDKTDSEFKKVTNQLNVELQVKISSNRKNSKLDRTIQKIRDFQSKIKAEHSFLTDRMLLCTYMNRQYLFMIGRLEAILRQIDSMKEETFSLPGIQDVKVSNRYLDIAAMLKDCSISTLNIQRKILHDLFERLQASIFSEERPIYYISALLESRQDLMGTEPSSEIDKSLPDIVRNNIEALVLCRDVLSRYYYKSIRIAYQNTQTICQEILKDFLEENERLQIMIDDSSNRLSIHYHIDNKPMRPGLLLNSFRYKLYTFCIKISIAFSVMKTMNISFPLVMDDVFYSSDFENREKVGDIIYKLYQLYASILGSQTNPLQIIFFTHDEIVLQSIIKRLNASNLKEQILFGRIFDYKEMELEKITEGHCPLFINYLY